MFLPDEFEVNREKTCRNQDIVNVLDIVVEVRDFINKLGFLASGKDFLMLNAVGVINGNIILNSAAKTMESIRYCCMNSNFADAYTLLRKLRDDLFYYVYLFAVADQSDFTKLAYTDELNKDEKNVWNWVHNQQKNLHIGTVLKCIASNSYAKEAVEKFNLKDSFDKLADKLNNYVHSNGYLFYNESLDRLAMTKKTKEMCNEFSETVIFVTVTFLFLVVLIRPLLIMSDDYTDYLEFNDTPPKNSQYWVAPFVSDFLCKYKRILDENCEKYLREKTGMQI